MDYLLKMNKEGYLILERLSKALCGKSEKKKNGKNKKNKS
jgi:hypothetical protein